MMREKLDSLYSLPLSLGETIPSFNWDEDLYTIDSFKREISSLEGNKLFQFILDIASEGVLECSILSYALGVFQETSSKYLISKQLNILTVNNVIIEKKSLQKT
jgi:hypothetical protein